MFSNWFLPDALSDQNAEPKLFVFAAGGSGMRVIEALTMLTSAGYFDEEKYTIVPILFDYDYENPSLLQAEESLWLYRQLHQECGPSSFFSHKITPLYHDDSSFLFDMEQEDKSLLVKYHLREYFKEHDLLRKLTESLMGDLNAPESILGEHFNNTHAKSGPAPCNYARLLMGDLSHRDDFSRLFNQVHENDAFVVVGSTYGNTGTASIFELAHSLNMHFHSMRKAAVLLLPFFKTTQNDNPFTKFDTEEMKMRSKDTLSFFIKHHIIDRFNCTYFIPAQTLSWITLQSNGQKQHIPFTIFDIMAVTAISDFLRKRDAELSNPNFFHLSLPRHRSEEFCIDDLCAMDSGKRVVECLTRFSLSMKYVHEIQTENDRTFWKHLKRFAEIYYDWIDSMNGIDGGNRLSLFKLRDSKFNQILMDRVFVRKRFGFNKQLFSKEDFIHAMGDSHSPLIEQLTRASNYIFDNYISEEL